MLENTSFLTPIVFLLGYLALADLIERERCREVAESVDLLLKLGDHLFCNANGIGTRNEAARWLLQI